MAASRRLAPLRPSIRLSPAHSRDNSRSTSPERTPGSLYPKIDPLLSNLSPESTLHALTSTEAVPANGEFSHLLSQSISQVSPAERALGIRAAIAARNLNLWHKEVQSWAWPKVNEAAAGKGFIPPVSSLEDSSSPSTSGGITYYGSLPAEVVEEYEKRIEEIRDGMDNLDVDELKEHVLNAHIPSRSRPSSSTSTVSVPPPLSYVQLSDFTAIVTATILRALPYLARLNHLLNIWEVRLLVLRHIPGLLRELRSTRSALVASSHVIQSSNTCEDVQTRFSSSHLRDQHVQLESAVIAVGKRVDRALDALEDRNDSLPEQWIDDLESIEADFAAWVVETERYKLRTEWLRAKPPPVVADLCQKSESSPEEVLEKEIDIQTASTVVGSHPAEQPTLTETTREEPRPESQVPSSTELAVQEHPDQNSASSADNRLMLLTSVPDRSSSLAAPRSTIRDDTNEKAGRHAHVAFAEDLQTPTQLTFSQSLSLPTAHVQSPSRIPLPVTTTVENKENIPPQDFVPQQSLSVREPGSKPIVLGEHKDDDIFGQKTSPDVLESKEEKSTTGSSLVSPTLEGLPASEGLLNEEASELEKEAFDKDANENLTTSKDESNTVIVAAENPPPVEKIPESAVEDESATTKAPATPANAQGSSGVPPRESSAKSTPKQSGNMKSHIPRPLPAQVTAYAAPNKEHVREQQAPSKKKPLQSPIKLSKVRQGKLNLDQGSPKGRARRPSTGSVGSFMTDSSLASPHATEPRTGSSNGDRLHGFPKSVSPRGDYLLRADRLRRLENSKMSAHSSFQPSRSVSLPLQRFINEKLDLDLSTESVPEIPERLKSKTPAVANIPDVASTPTQVQNAPKRRHVLVRGKSVSDLKSADSSSNPPDRSLPAFGGNTARRAMQHQDQPKSARLRQRLTAHPSLESLGVKKQELSYVEEDESELIDSGSRSSSPNRLSRKPRDHLDEKINSILSTLPGRIHLVDPSNEADTSSSSSSMDRKMRERYLSESPHGPPSRSLTPAPSLTLMPAARRRLSHAHKTEDSYVKLYHLHHGGQTAPTKLFVRTVGEDGQRVMVRVGGGWADLGEYLREYVVHHGRRKVSETPRVEVQGLATRSSPGYPSPANLIPPTVPPFNSGRVTPSRPPSVIGTRPPSSLAVRKPRRDSIASEVVSNRSVTTGTLSAFTSPPSAGPTARRLSMSSSYSFGDVQSPAHLNVPSHDNSTPLGLAGPKPRSRQISMSPEGEAWVENVLKKTRRSTTSFIPTPFDPNRSPENDDLENDLPDLNHHTGRSLPKVRSIGDISLVGTGRRVVLRGLGNHR
ncbi:hypothetical protein N7466_003193 [Penicillium verhagenii]|uniref:uncharacterized protein n=1 Tax=Penicillium verhagenii TaxID=1562060 RepID=UPI00254507B8|nr:uncharacterized protein N7466_003193 [Penicillium verhagenii]KAJ5936743.1 hypothetical protein N7466_003193 [Penicillium verhagenii]